MKKGVYGLALFLLLVGVGIIGFTISNKTDDNFSYVSKGILDYEPPVQVVATEASINKPFLGEEIKSVKSYYDYKADENAQKSNLLFFENTYMPSTGIAYSNGNPFDVLSILSGTVTEVKTDETLGNSITITHDNGIVSVYQSVTDIAVKEGDPVVQGEKLATSSTSNISSDLGNHLYFELIVNGECVNPENYYGKTISEV